MTVTLSDHGSRTLEVPTDEETAEAADHPEIAAAFALTGSAERPGGQRKRATLPQTALFRALSYQMRSRPGTLS